MVVVVVVVEASKTKGLLLLLCSIFCGVKILLFFSFFFEFLSLGYQPSSLFLDSKKEVLCVHTKQHTQKNGSPQMPREEDEENGSGAPLLAEETEEEEEEEEDACEE